MNHMNSVQNPLLTVYFDGLCRLCSAEIEHYRHQAGADRIHFLDITGPDFDAAREGVDGKEVHQVMHVRRADGTLATRVDAFIEIWKCLPKFNWAARAATFAPVRAALELGYSGFARIRPYLPRKTRECADSPYCELKHD
jgi:predicted DCC family thiol-disulfide oxidoreductase YuxK